MSTKRLTSVILGLGFFLGLSTTLVFATPRALELLQGPPEVSLLTTDKLFIQSKTMIVDFSSYECCFLLQSDYYVSHGITFTRRFELGWGTSQDDGFATHISVDPVRPGAPAGITGTRLILAQPTKKVGMFIQSGFPFKPNQTRPSKSIIINAYDINQNKVFSYSTDTCLGEAATCVPKFIGVKSEEPIIKFVEILINEAEIWSIDDVKIESKWIYPYTDPYPSPRPYPYPYPSPPPYPYPYPYP